MRGFIIISEKPLDLAALAERCCDIGEIFLNSPRELIVDNDDKDLWFKINVYDKEDSQNMYSGQQLARIRALVGRPMCAVVECVGSNSIDVAVSRLPSEGIFIDNDHGVIFTIKEIRRRLEVGEEWERFGEEFL